MISTLTCAKYYKLLNDIYNSMPDKINDDSILQGRCLYILMSFELFKITRDKTFKINAEKHLDQLAGSVLKYRSCNLGYGLCGILYTLVYLANSDFIEVDSRFFDAYDEELFFFVDRVSKSHNYDLLSGLIGIGIYYIELGKLEKRLKNNVYYVIDKVILLSTEIEKSIYWEYKFERPPKNYNGVVNLGLLHGMPSVLLFLLICYKENYKSDFYEDKIRNGLKFITSNQYINNFGFSYSHYFGIKDGVLKKEILDDSFAYCKGDLGIILLFQKAYEVLGDESFRKYSKELYHNIQDKLVEIHLRKLNPYFCHGKAGILTLVNVYEKLNSDIGSKKKVIEALTNDLIFDFNVNNSNNSLLEGNSGVLFALVKLTYSIRSIERLLLLN